MGFSRYTSKRRIRSLSNLFSCNFGNGKWTNAKTIVPKQNSLYGSGNQKGEKQCNRDKKNDWSPMTDNTLPE